MTEMPKNYVFYSYLSICYWSCFTISIWGWLAVRWQFWGFARSDGRVTTTVSFFLATINEPRKRCFVDVEPHFYSLFTQHIIVIRVSYIFSILYFPNTKTNEQGWRRPAGFYLLFNLYVRRRVVGWRLTSERRAEPQKTGKRMTRLSDIHFISSVIRQRDKQTYSS